MILNMKNKQPMVLICVLLMACLLPGRVAAQYTEADMRAYVEQYKDVAMEKMKQYKIPASITLAQGIFESACGKSRLATEGNNHFGIKCHTDWAGDTILVDDDELQECFRKYDSVAASYTDHSLFLTTRRRYANLFALDILDYPAWARTLKADGYATNPQYADRLISLIERFNIARLDTLCLEQQGIAIPKPIVQTHSRASQSESDQNLTAQSQNAEPEQKKPLNRPKIEYTNNHRADAQAKSSSVETNNHASLPQSNVPQSTENTPKPQEKPAPVGKFKVFTADGDYPTGASPFTYRKVFTNNNTYFVVAEAGDTYEKIATDVQVSAANLRRFNDAGKDGQPVEKEIVYIESKAKNNDAKVHVVERGETLRYISQRYAVQLHYIFKYNNLDENSIIQPGNQILLKH